MQFTDPMPVLQVRTARRGCGSCRRKRPAMPRRTQRRPLPSGRTAGKSPSAQCSLNLWPCTGAVPCPFTLELLLATLPLQFGGRDAHALTCRTS